MLHSDTTKYLEADLLVERDGPVAESDGVAEAGLPLDCLLGKVHNNLGTLGIWMEQKWADGKGSADTAALDGQAPLGLVVASVRRGWERATEGV